MKNQILKVACIQMCSSESVEDNLTEAEKLIQQAAFNGASLIVLPEYFISIDSDPTAKLKFQEPLNKGVIQIQIAEWAKTYQVWIFAGSIPTQSDDPKRPFSTLGVFNSEGELVSHYHKIHLFDALIDDAKGASQLNAYFESKFCKAGTVPQVVDTPWGKVGLAICYDLRFPELFQYYQKEQVDLIVCPAAFTVPTGEAHWEVLLRARAIETQSFVIAAAQAGEHQSGRKTYGHSMAVDPWGNIIGELQQEQGILLAELDFSEVKRVKTNMPILQHKRL